MIRIHLTRDVGNYSLADLIFSSLLVPADGYLGDFGSQSKY